MTSRVQNLASLLAADMNYYAGDPQVLNADRYPKKIEAVLRSVRADQLTARVAIHAQLRAALKDKEVQKKLAPYLEPGESLNNIATNAEARSKFFSKKQQVLQAAILASPEQAALKEAHGELAAWEKENAVLLRHPMFMTYVPSQALLLESAATVALYRHYATNEEGQYTSESSEGEIPDMLKKLGGKPYFTKAQDDFQVDEHNKMYSQQVLENKRVEYEQRREKVAQCRAALISSQSVLDLEAFINIRNEIFTEYGIDRLVSLCMRKDRELADPNEGGIDATLRDAPADDEYVTAARAAQYSLPKIAEACYKNYCSILSTEDWDAMIKNTGSAGAREVIEKSKPLKDKETFRYWFLSSITADSPQLGPNKLVGKGSTTLKDYKQFWAPQKSNYVASLNNTSRSTFATKVAEARGLSHIVVLSPFTYSYRENNDPNAIKTGSFDLVVYDATNEKVLLILVNSSDERNPRAAFLRAQEERYRFAAAVRSAISYDNEYHGLTCQGTVAEYFFDPQDGPEENYYCIMAPYRMYAKTAQQMDVPISAFRPFTSCPPRYFVLGANWGVSSGTPSNPYPASFAHIEMNALAAAAVDALPDDFVANKVLPQLHTREEGLAELEEKKKAEDKAREAVTSPRSSTRSPRASAQVKPAEPTATEILERERNRGPTEDDDPLSPVVPADALHPIADELLKKQKWAPAPFAAARKSDAAIAALPAVKDGKLRTPIHVFETLAGAAPAGGHKEADSVPHSNNARQAANVAWF